MKKLILVLAGSLFFSGFVFSQYSTYKSQYDSRTYTPQPGDRYNPAGLGVASFFLTGLGQMIAGEGLRGTAFLLGDLGSLSLIAVGVAHGFGEADESAPKWAFTGLAFWALFKTWSVIDVVHVAKIKNLALRDKNPSALQWEIHPWLGHAGPLQGGTLIPGAGITLRF